MALLSLERWLLRSTRSLNLRLLVLAALAAPTLLACIEDTPATSTAPQVPTPVVGQPTVTPVLEPEFTPGEDARRVSVEEVAARGPYVRCVDPAPAGTVTLFAELPDLEDDLVTVASDHPCIVAVGLRRGTGTVDMLPLPAGAYYNAATVAVGQHLVIMVTRLEIGAWDQRTQFMESHDVDPIIVALTLDAQGAASAPQVVLDREDEAVWLGQLLPSGESVSLTWWRDSLFEHMLFTPTGRPTSDGLYSATLAVDDAGFITLSDERQLRDYRLLKPGE
jgi:hypothetical protein